MKLIKSINKADQIVTCFQYTITHVKPGVFVECLDFKPN